MKEAKKKSNNAVDL